MTKTLSSGIFYLLAGLAIGWSALLSYSFLSRVLVDRHFLVPAAGLIVVELGAIAWSTVYLHKSKGTPQRSVSLVMTIACLIAMATLTMAELVGGGQELTAAPEIMSGVAVWAIAALTSATVIAVVVYHLVDPASRRQMAMQTSKDQLFDESLVRLEGKRQEVSATVSDAMAAEMISQILGELRQQDAGESQPLEIVKPVTTSTMLNSEQEVTTFSVNQNGEPAPKVERRSRS